jgi:UDP-N-acetylmuramoylalanine--D-glutamate ligase
MRVSCRMAVPGRRIISFGLDAPSGRAKTSACARIAASPGWSQGDRLLLPLRDLPLAGLHNAANAMAALALCEALGYRRRRRCWPGCAVSAACRTGSSGLPILTASPGTTTPRAPMSVPRLPRLKGLAGSALTQGERCPDSGRGREGQDFSPLHPVARHARAVVLIGRDGPLIEGFDGHSAAFRSKCFPTWKRLSPCPHSGAQPATQCCCRRPVPASTCSAITSTGPRSSLLRYIAGAHF